MNNKTKAHIAVITVNFLFGTNYSMVKYISPRVIQPFGLNLIRVGISVILFWLLFLTKPSRAGIQSKHILRFFLCGLTGVAINQMLFIKGLTLSSSIHASLLILATPIFITLFAIILKYEKLTFLKVTGLFMGIGGAALLVLSKESTVIGSNVVLGDILLTINAISYAIYFLLVKKLLLIYSPIHVIRWVFSFGLLIIIPFAWNEFEAIKWDTYLINDFLALAFVVIGATFFTYLLNVYGLHHLNASTVGSYIYLQPVYAAIIAVIFLGEHLTTTKIIAAFLIFLGVYFANKISENKNRI